MLVFPPTNHLAQGYPFEKSDVFSYFLSQTIPMSSSTAFQYQSRFVFALCDNSVNEEISCLFIKDCMFEFLICSSDGVNTKSDNVF